MSKNLINVVWNRINPWSVCDCDLDLLDAYSVGQLLLEMECNTQDRSSENIKRQAIAEMQNRLETAIEIVDNHKEVFAIYLFEETNSREDHPDLYLEDDYNIHSTHIKRIVTEPYSRELLVSYRGYIKAIDDLESIPSWDSLPDYFVNGELV